ncbi:CKLF4-like protein [Mya arenaria]|uniref:CKLF4-like protein n=1 Tax=Mya arenaria TaxID=6604 RepID=A0ABY7ER85_MYAAR|nr:MARVEL domain-containing protein 1-like isoform X1 [Mya arenaria]XP_052816683.1 MARVEL domain-containing protein 1-like isoform X1 [Mya arenaria]WAR11654.1 CKLF4-like protein [Mya arenaria]
MAESIAIGFDRNYPQSLHGILKIVEVVVDLVAFICACWFPYWSGHGGAWVQFVTISAFITTLILLVLHLFRIIYKLPGPWGLIELIYYGVYALLLLIAAIVAAARAGYHSSIGAAAFFTFAATALYVVDAFFQFRTWRGGATSHTQSSETHTTTTTTTETNYETKAQY